MPSINMTKYVTVAIVLASMILVSCSGDGDSSAARKRRSPFDYPVPFHTVLKEHDTSHSAARRINVFARLESDCTKDQVRNVVRHLTESRMDYNIVWVYVLPPDVKEDPSYLHGYFPIVCVSKWISMGLNVKWHTTSDGFPEVADETYWGIYINWINPPKS